MRRWRKVLRIFSALTNYATYLAEHKNGYLDVHQRILRGQINQELESISRKLLEELRRTK